MTIGERMKKIRDDHGVTMQVFGDRIATDSSTVSKMEKGQRTITDRSIKLICSEFNINETWLRTGDGEMYIKKTPFRELGESLRPLLGEGKNVPLKRKLIMELMKLDDQHWDTILDIAQSIVDEMNNVKKELPEE